MCGIGCSSLSGSSQYTGGERNGTRVSGSVQHPTAVFIVALLVSHGGNRKRVSVQVGVKWQAAGISAQQVVDGIQNQVRLLWSILKVSTLGFTGEDQNPRSTSPIGHFDVCVESVSDHRGLVRSEP